MERVSLRDQRLGSVQSVLKASRARRCWIWLGPGALLTRLVKDGYELVVGVDVSVRSLEQAARQGLSIGASIDRTFCDPSSVIDVLE